MTGTSRVRAWIACFGLAICFTGFSSRLVYLQTCRQCPDPPVVKTNILARRGVVQDRFGEPLAANEPVQTVIADGSLIKESEVAAMAQMLAEPLGMKVPELQERLTTDRRYIVLKKKVSEAAISVVKKKIAVSLAVKGKDDPLRIESLKGIAFEQDAVRIYPNGTMLGHVIGFTNGEHEGVQGIESAMDEHLRGRDGFRYTERDRRGKELVAFRGQERAVRDGCTVRLTIDMCLQNIVENELNTACAQFKPKGAIAILMRPKTGEILAIANRPNFDPNAPGEGKGEAMKNAAILDMVEPGSTFKIVTAAAALNERIVKLDSTVFCENGSFSYAGRWLHDHHPYGTLSVEDVLVKSSNIGAAKIAMQLGEQRLYEYIRRFGFGERTGVALPGEIAGMIHPPHHWTKISITRVPMGHEVGVTPIQIVSAMGAIANGGKLMMPQIVHEIVDDEGATVASYPPVVVRQVVSPETAKLVTTALKGVVSARGTAALANVFGYKVAGKTGTAQKVDPKGGYTPGKYVVSFVGFMPADDPQIVGLVMLDDAQTKAGENFGGQVAAPIFARIGEQAARHLNLIPEMEALPTTMVATQKTPLLRTEGD